MSKVVESESHKEADDVSTKDVIITVSGNSKLGDALAEFVAQEVARALDNLEAFGVSKDGDFGCVNSDEERAARFKKLVRASRERVTVHVGAERDRHGEREREIIDMMLANIQEKSPDDNIRAFVRNLRCAIQDDDERAEAVAALGRFW